MSAIPADQFVAGLYHHVEVFLVLIDPGLSIEAVENSFYDVFVQAVAKSGDQLVVTLHLLVLSPHVADVNRTPVHGTRNMAQEFVIPCFSETPDDLRATGNRSINLLQTKKQG